MPHTVMWYSNNSLYPQLVIFKSASLEDLSEQVNNFLSETCNDLSDLSHIRVDFSIKIKQLNNVDNKGNRWFSSILYNRRKKEIPIEVLPVI